MSVEHNLNELARFRMVVGGLAASACISFFYGFNLLSNHLQAAYGLGGSDLTTITTTGIVVGFVTFPGGMLLDHVGPMWVLIIATTCLSLGTLLFGLVFNGFIAASVVRFSVFCAIMNFGCATFDTGSLMAVLGSFPLTKGSVVALMKTFAGLGASVLAVINYSFFRERYAAYMYFMTGAAVFLGSVAAFFIRFPPYHLVDYEKTRVPMEIQLRRQQLQRYYLQQHPPMQRFALGFTIMLSLVVYLTTQALCVAYVHGITDTTRMGITVGAILLVLSLSLIAAPLPFLGGMSVPPSEEFPALPDDPMEAPEGCASAEARHEPHEPTNSVVTRPVAITSDEEAMAESDLDPQYQGTFWQDLKTLDLWLMWWNTLATWGCGLVISFNSAQIYRALNNNVYEAATNSLYSAIIGVGSALGRLSMGLLEMIFLRCDPERRPAITCLYPVGSSFLVVGLLFLLTLPTGSKAIIIGFFLDAFGNGFSWACTALTVRSLYAKDIGKHYNFMFVGALIAVIALNRFAYGEQFTRQARKNGTYPYCGGKACVQSALIILICTNASAIVVSTVVHIRYRRFVKKTRDARCAQAQNCKFDDEIEAANLNASDMNGM